MGETIAMIVMFEAEGNVSRILLMSGLFLCFTVSGLASAWDLTVKVTFKRVTPDFVLVYMPEDHTRKQDTPPQ
jgi:hypothetical protein